MGVERWPTAHDSWARAFLQMSFQFVFGLYLSHIITLLLEVLVEVFRQTWLFICKDLQNSKPANIFAVVTTDDPACGQAVYPLQSNTTT